MGLYRKLVMAERCPFSFKQLLELMGYKQALEVNAWGRRKPKKVYVCRNDWIGIQTRIKNKYPASLWSKALYDWEGNTIQNFLLRNVPVLCDGDCILNTGEMRVVYE